MKWKKIPVFQNKVRGYSLVPITAPHMSTLNLLPLQFEKHFCCLFLNLRKLQMQINIHLSII